jgi:hypothetical protein
MARDAASLTDIDQLAERVKSEFGMLACCL